SRSTSCTKSLKIVTVHCSAARKFTFGVMTKLSGAPGATVASLWLPVVTQLMPYQPVLTSTGSVKLRMMLASRGAFGAFVAGSVFTIAGPISEMPAVRGGFGAPARKSLPLTFVSVLPPFLRSADVVLLGAGALVPPSLQFAVP